MKRMLVLALALCALAPLWAQEATFADLIAGKAAALTIKAKALGPGWIRLRTGSQPGMDDISRAFSAMLGGAGLGVYYTKGQTVTLEGEKFLVAYSMPLPPNEGEPGERLKVEPLTENSDLMLSLLKVKTLGSLLDIAPVDAGKEIKTAAAAAEQALITTSTNNMRQLVTAVLMFSQDHDELMPTANEWNEVLKMIPTEARTQPRFNVPYAYNTAVAGFALGEFDDPTGTVVAYEANAWTNGKVVVGFLDGHVEVVPTDRLKALLDKVKPKRAAVPAADAELQKKSVENVKQLVMIAQMYAQDHDELMPTVKAWDALIAKQPEGLRLQPRFDVPYIYNAAVAGIALGKIEDPEATVCIYEANAWPDGNIVVGYMDGHFALVKIDVLKETLKKLGDAQREKK
jgi:prepilin-type processing-associated H-X9-DG protein